MATTTPSDRDSALAQQAERESVSQDIATLLAMPDTGEFELDIPSRKDLPKPPRLD